MQRLSKALIFRCKLNHNLLDLLLALALFRNILLQRFDQIQIITRDVVVIILNLPEHLVVGLLQIVDVKIFSLLDFMDFNLLKL